MNLAHLTSPMQGIARRLRLLRYWREHQALGRLDIVRRFAADCAGGDPFEHLAERDYLVRGLSARERLQYVLSHYRFEDASFNSAYKEAVYGAQGLVLWQHDHEAGSFVLRLEMAPRHDAEGELTIALLVGGQYLHRLSFTWLDGDLAGVNMATVPFVTRNQGRWADSGAAFDAFEQAFPNNSPSFFCFAAMQGMAQALGMDRVLAIKCSAHVAYDPNDLKHFENAYDGFWRILGGVEMSERSYLVRLPFYLKPLEDMPSKHRKRAALRRENWRAIGDSTRTTILRHVAAAAATAGARAPAQSHAAAEA